MNSETGNNLLVSFLFLREQIQQIHMLQNGAGAAVNATEFSRTRTRLEKVMHEHRIVSSQLTETQEVLEKKVR
jgi:hypothetical protein